MSLEDVEKLLGEVSDQQQKTIALLDKLAKDAGKPKQRDGWDKFQIVTGFISGVLLAVVGTGFTWLYQNIERHRQDKLQQQQAEVQARQSTFQEVDLVAKFMPYLTGGDDLKRQHAVRTLRLIGDPDMAVQIANEFGGKELALTAFKMNPTLTVVKAYNAIQSNPEAGQNIAGVELRQGKDLKVGSTILFDGFTNYSLAGFNFATAKIVPWGTNQPDLEAANPDSGHATPAVLFLENDVPPYTSKEWPPGKVPANAGVVRMSQQRLEEVREAPESGYDVHYFKPEKGGVYCIRTWDGQHFAKIKVTDVGTDRIAFDWVYQPSRSRTF